MKDYQLETTSIWRFPNRGSWATHKGTYRGNWSPYVPRNLILKYTKENDVVLDLFVGSGTTLIETKLLHRNGIGIDINASAIELAKTNLEFNVDSSCTQKLLVEDARKTSLDNTSIDLICMHPPYANIVKYSDGIKGDLSLLDIEDFLEEWNSIAKESRRVLKHNGICAYMIGDCRRHGSVFPLGFESLQVFRNNGFKLKEIIIKEQFNCSSTDYWKEKSKKMGFYLLAHEYIFILKP